MTRESGEETSGVEALGLTYLSPNRSTSWGKDMATVAKGGAIDHIIGNMEARDLMVTSDVQQQATLSDHMSVCAKCVVPRLPRSSNGRRLDLPQSSNLMPLFCQTPMKNGSTPLTVHYVGSCLRLSRVTLRWWTLEDRNPSQKRRG